MAGIITRGSTPKLMWPGLNAIVDGVYSSYEPEWEEIFEKSKSNKAYEEDVGITGMGLAPIKPEGEAVIYDDLKQNFVTRYTHVAYSLGFIITHEEIADNLYAKFGEIRARSLARSMYLTKETIAANVLNNGFDTNFAGGDGAALFSTSHPIEGGTFQNKLTVDADLSEAALEQACIDISNFVDQRGNRIKILPQKLIIPSTLQFEAERILKNPVQANTAERNINAMYQMGKIPQGVRINHYLTDQDAWFILTDCPEGMKYFEREAPILRDDNDFETLNAKFSGYERYCVGWTDSRGIYGSQGG